PWPTLRPEALYGLAGEIVRTIEPHTEADPAAVLLHILAMAGNAVGVAPHAIVSGHEHRANIFGLVVGRSSESRTGTSASYPRQLSARAEPEWRRECVSMGLSSGEGLIEPVRDLTTKEIDDGSKPRDRRLFALESEFGRLLKTMTRDGNILNPVLRQAWDS